MKGDFTRHTFDPRKHFTEVLFQQGRVQLDADLNEQQEIIRHSVRTEARDVIGWAGVPKYGGGFNIDVTKGGEDLTISPGRIYVDGLLCIAESTSVNVSALVGQTLTVERWPGKLLEKLGLFELRADGGLVWRMRAAKVEEVNRVIHLERELTASDLEKVKGPSKLTLRPVLSYRHQPDLPSVPVNPSEAGTYLVYLDVWERLITPLDDPDIREKGLGGPDTAVRAKVVWQVKLEKALDNAACTDFGPDWKPLEAVAGGKLNVRTAPVPVKDDPCLLPGQAGYRGLENQLYRVEIHQGGKIGTDEVTFKWSRDNGSVITRINEINGSTLVVSGLGPDEVHGFSDNDWVEIVDDATELSQRSGPLVQVKTADRATNTLILKDTSESLPSHIDKTLHYKLGRWDCAGPCKAEIPVTNDGWTVVEYGLEIKFSAGETYRSGDYWLIPARTAVGSETGSLEWPQDVHGLPIAQPPHGIEHRYAPLALVKVENGLFKVPPISDCRNPFPPLIEVGESEPSAKGAPCCTYAVGDGKESHGDFNDIQEAIDRLPSEGGQICLLPGDHQVNALIEDKTNIAIRGCGLRTKVSPLASKPKEPVFKVIRSSQILFSDLYIVSYEGVAIALDGNGTDRLQDVRVENCRILGYRAGLHVQEGTRIAIRNNQIQVLDRRGGGVAVYMAASDSAIEHNDITVLSESYLGKLEIKIPGIEKLFNPHDNCAEFEPLYRNRSSFMQLTNMLTIAGQAPDKQTMLYVSSAEGAQGGIQIAAGSERIRICENCIRGGTGNGITLGGRRPLQGAEGEKPAFLGQLVKAIDHRGGAIHGEVRKRDFSLAEATIVATSVDSGTTFFGVLDGQGRFTLPNVPAGPLAISMLSPRYELDGLSTDGADGSMSLSVAEKETTKDQEIWKKLGFLREIVIEDNRIFQMGLSGIGSFYAGEEGDQATTGASLSRESYPVLERILSRYGNPILDLTISRNHVAGCLKERPSDDLRRQLMFKGVGGISIGICEDLTIVENRIEHNGLAPLPASGIFIGYGEHIEISLNRIQQNGAVPLKPIVNHRDDGQGLFRGGIFILLGSCLFDPEATERGQYWTSWGQHAVRIHGNTVSQPIGRALWLGALGPVAVQDNHFGSHACGDLIFQRLGGAVCIVNLGRPQCDRKQPGDNLPGGDILFSDNQSQVGVLHSSWLPHLVFSLDDVGFEANQLRTNQMLFKDKKNNEKLYINTLVWAQTARARGNRFQEREMNLAASLVSWASEMNITTNNQGDHCIFALPEENTSDSKKLIETNNQQRANNCVRVLNEVRSGVLEFAKGGTEWLTGIVEGLALLRSDKLAPLQQMRDMQAAYRVLLQYEAEHLKTAHGEYDPRVLEMQNRLRRNLALVEKLEVEDQLRQIKVKEALEKESLVHGRITDESSRGLVGFTVALTDREGKDLGVAEAKVDSTGYYSFLLSEEQAARLEADKTRVYLTIKNRKGEICQRRPVARTVGAGVRLSEIVTLSRSKQAAAAASSTGPLPPRKSKQRKK